MKYWTSILRSCQLYYGAEYFLFANIKDIVSHLVDLLGGFLVNLWWFFFVNWPN